MYNQFNVLTLYIKTHTHIYIYRVLLDSIFRLPVGILFGHIVILGCLFGLFLVRRACGVWKVTPQQGRPGETTNFG